VAGRTLGRSFSTRETVWWDTPARRATSKIVAALARSSSVVTVPVVPGLRGVLVFLGPDTTDTVGAQVRLDVSTFCRMMNTNSKAPMKIFVHHELRVPSKLMTVWIRPSTRTPSAEPSTKP